VKRVGVAFVLLTLAAGPAAGAELDVFAGVAPVSFLVSRIGGDRVTVHTLLPAGANPHAYEPTARQLSMLSDARAYFATTMPFETGWLPRLRATFPSLAVVTLPGAGADPHAWTSAGSAAAMTEAIRDALVRLDPAGAERYRANAVALLGDLDGLDARVRDSLAPARGRAFFVYHPAWSALADAYGLEQVAIEAEGKSPGARHLARVIERARAVHACAIFVQPQISPRAAAEVARAVGARVVVLDPLAPDLIANLEQAARTIAANLEQPCPR